MLFSRYCVLYFLETYASARKEHMNHLLRDYEAGRLPVPIPSHVRRNMYAKLQTDILRSPPFTDTSTLISTHHCMYLLVSCLLRTLSPGQTDFVDPHWIGGLLTASGLGRVVEYFSAEIGDGVKTRARRRDFMTNFERDIDLYVREEMHPCVYLPPPNGQPHYPTVHEVWLDAAIRELSSRHAIPHDPGKVTIWNGATMLMACDNCLATDGWMTA